MSAPRPGPFGWSIETLQERLKFYDDQYLYGEDAPGLTRDELRKKAREEAGKIRAAIRVLEAAGKVNFKKSEVETYTVTALLCAIAEAKEK